MRNLRTTLEVTLLTLLAACGGGGDDGGGNGDGGNGGRDGASGEIDPSVATVDPPNGPLAGGDAISITGMNLAGRAEAYVMIGDRLATDVTVDGDGTIHATTPPGPELGPQDVVVFNTSGFVTAPDGYTYNPAPTITDVEPTLPPEGGTITVTGTGFTSGLAGDNTVTVGGAACAGLSVTSDTSLTCTAGVGTAWGVPIVLSNRNGDADGLVRYARDELFAIDGRGANSGSVYTVNTADATTTPIATLTVPFTSVGIAPDGRALAFEAIGESSRRAGMYSLDFDFTATLIGPTAFRALPAAVGTPRALYAWDKDSQSLRVMDTTTGTGTPITLELGGSGNGLAAFSDGKLFYTPNGAAGQAYLIDPVAGTATQLGTMTGGPGGGNINSLAFHHGVLYGVVRNEGFLLVTIDPTTLAVTTVGGVPGSVEALLSGVPDAPASPTPPVDPPPPPAVRRPLPDVDLVIEGPSRPSSHRGRRAMAVARDVVATTCDGARVALTAPAGGELVAVQNTKGQWKVVARGADGEGKTVARGICRVTEVSR